MPAPPEPKPDFRSPPTSTAVPILAISSPHLIRLLPFDCSAMKLCLSDLGLMTASPAELGNDNIKQMSLKHCLPMHFGAPTEPKNLPSTTNRPRKSFPGFLRLSRSSLSQSFT